MIITRVSIFKISYLIVAILCFVADTAEGNSGTMAEIPTEPESTSTEDAMMSQSADMETIDTSESQRSADDVESVPTKASTAGTPDDATTSLSFWGIVRSFLHWIRDDLIEGFPGEDHMATASANYTANGSAAAAATASTSTAETADIEGRTFGKIRRLQMAMIPIIFKFGVLSAMVAFLVILGMKTIFLLKVLILMNAAVILGKFLTFKHQSHETYEHGPWSFNNWNTHTPSHGAHSAPSKEIHLHIHGGGAHHPEVSSHSASPSSYSSNWDRHHDPYNSYDPSSMGSDFDNDLINQGPISALPTKYPDYRN